MIRVPAEVPTAPVQLARRMQGMNASAVREILKVAEKPEIISFAGGLPAPELFPVEPIAAAYEKVFAREGQGALQYGVTEGFLPLRQWIAARMQKRGIPSTPEQLLITSGSQQGIDLTARILLDPGDAVAVESPTYLAAIQVFTGYQAKLVPIESDDGGMRLDSLERALKSQRIKLLYLVTEFQNPKGTSLAADRRDALVKLAQAHGVVVLEDDPYGEIRFSGEPSAPLAARSENVIHLGTFSKTLAPGMRIGWMHGPKELLRAATIAKQAADLHTATLAQRAAAALLETFDYDANLAKLRAAYSVRHDAMQRALAKHMPEGTRWTKAQGGMFLWLQLPEGVTDEMLFKRAIAAGVAVVPGSPFFAGRPSHQFARLNYSNQTEARINEGIERLGAAMRAV